VEQVCKNAVKLLSNEVNVAEKQHNWHSVKLKGGMFCSYVNKNFEAFPEKNLQ